MKRVFQPTRKGTGIINTCLDESLKERVWNERKCSKGLALLLASISGRAYVVLRSLFGFVRFRKRRRVCSKRYTCWPLQDAIICKQLNWKTLPLEGSMACVVHDFFRRTRMPRRKSAPIGYLSCVVLHFFMASKHSIELIWVCLVLGKYTVW